MADEAMRQWEERRAEARRLEADLEAHLIRLEGLDADADAGHCDALHAEALRLVEQLRRCSSQMRIAADDAGGPKAASLRQQAERYEDIGREKDRALVRIQNTLSSKRARRQLLTTVHHEMEEYAESQNMRMLGREQDSIHKSLTATQALLEQAAAGKAQLETQRGMFGKISGTLGTLREKLPGVDSTLGRIQNRRHRETIVLSTVVAICLFLIWVFW
eukprot:TRINITY_DN51730_c0_g1_i1.p1 TRINITY_DN51730_c0_g1~~TRINITY_DN51730_c0_g1_i1.p1  ORF type:complete len:241 (+),score=85.81 TRINITY_DN51730_c0_g1_i1:70-723(+)